MPTMTINFEVETGTGSATATSYATVTQFKQWCLDRGNNLASSDTDDHIEAWLNAATEFMDITYRYKGDPTFVTTQALQWPRLLVNQLGVVWAFMQNRQIASNIVPAEIIKACCYLAYEAKQGPLHFVNEGVKMRSFGPVNTKYDHDENDRVYPYVEKLLGKFLITNDTKVLRVN